MCHFELSYTSFPQGKKAGDDATGEGIAGMKVEGASEDFECMRKRVLDPETPRVPLFSPLIQCTGQDSIWKKQ